MPVPAIAGSELPEHKKGQTRFSTLAPLSRHPNYFTTLHQPRTTLSGLSTQTAAYFSLLLTMENSS